jgi:hypothetical protein
MGLDDAVGVVVGVGPALGVSATVADGVGVGTTATGAPVRERPTSAPAPTLSAKATASRTPY